MYRDKIKGKKIVKEFYCFLFKEKCVLIDIEQSFEECLRRTIDKLCIDVMRTIKYTDELDNKPNTYINIKRMDFYNYI